MKATLSNSTDAVPMVRIVARTFREMLDRTLFAAGRDPARPYLSTVLIETQLPRALRLVASDGYRLAVVERDCEVVDLPPGLVVQRKPLTDLHERLVVGRSDAQMTLVLTDRGLDVRTTDDTSIILPVLRDVTFPYHEAIPKSHGITAEVPCEEFLDALYRLYPKHSPTVRLHFDHGRLDVVSDANPQFSALSMRYDARPLTITFNTHHLTDVLRLHAAYDIISIGITDDASPVVIRGSRDPRFTYVLMPVLEKLGL